jgi:hypothetical protein
MSFAQLKKNRTKSLEALTSELEKMNSKGYSDPLKEKYWKLARDSAGNGYAVIRFLPAPEGEDVPFVRIWEHGFQSTGGWYIEKSLTTLGQDDPVSKYNSQLWNTGIDADKDKARDQKRKLKYHANILVVKDPANPENEGKVFLFAFGKKIFDKLNDLMHPEFEDETPKNPFDFWGGANFKLKMRKVDGYPNFDKSEFEDPTELFDGDETKLEEIYNQLNSLQELIAPSQFKTYEELEARLHLVLGIGKNTSRNTSSKAGDAFDADMDVTKIGKSQEAAETKSSDSLDSDASFLAGDDDDDLEFFKNLASD